MLAGYNAHMWEWKQVILTLDHEAKLKQSDQTLNLLQLEASSEIIREKNSRLMANCTNEWRLRTRERD